MSKIVSLSGQSISEDRRESSRACVEVLKDLLERAESGEVIGVVAVAVNYDETVDIRHQGEIGSFRVAGAIDHLRFTIQSFLFDIKDEDA